jgi:dihydroxy-acid dehydratase
MAANFSPQEEWFSGFERDAIYHRGWMKNQGYPDDLFDGRPVIGICWPMILLRAMGICGIGRQRVKNGVWEAGGFRLNFQCLAKSESLR